MLKRKISDVIEQHLKSNSERILLIDGARQVGKTYIIRYVGKKLFANFIEINMLEDSVGNKLFANATTVAEQQEAADALNAAYMAQHYYLITSYAQEWNSYISGRVHGFTGARWTLCYNCGEIITNMWVDA